MTGILLLIFITLPIFSYVLYLQTRVLVELIRTFLGPPASPISGDLAAASAALLAIIPTMIICVLWIHFANDQPPKDAVLKFFHERNVVKLGLGILVTSCVCLTFLLQRPTRLCRHSTTLLPMIGMLTACLTFLAIFGWFVVSKELRRIAAGSARFLDGLGVLGVLLLVPFLLTVMGLVLLAFVAARTQAFYRRQRQSEAGK